MIETLKKRLRLIKGKLYWRNGPRAGDLAGFLYQGLRYVRINGHVYRHDRLVHYMQHGIWPPRKIRSDNKSGYSGVYAYGKRWRAQVTRNGKTIHVGTFDTIDEAVRARLRENS